MTEKLYDQDAYAVEFDAIGGEEGERLSCDFGPYTFLPGRGRTESG